MKKYMLIVIAFLVAALGVTTHKLKKANAKWEAATVNVKAYESLLSTSQEENRAFKLTIEQLKNSKDSIFEEMNAIRKELKIKDSKLQSMQYIGSSFSKVDSVVFRDTIFLKEGVYKDTLIKDDWYSLNLSLRYPSTVIAEPSFTSDKYIVTYLKKETVNPPKKFFLFRWFQKKYKVLNIEIVEKNPYVTNQKSRYVEIVK